MILPHGTAGYNMNRDGLPYFQKPMMETGAQFSKTRHMKFYPTGRQNASLSIEKGISHPYFIIVGGSKGLYSVSVAIG